MKELAALPKEIRLAALNAQRYAVAELKKSAVEETVRKYYITKSRVKKAMSSIPGGFKVRGGMQSLDHYKLSPTSPTKKYSLRGAVRRDSGLKSLGGRAFLMRGAKAGGKPFKRLSRKRFPVKLIIGPSIPQIVGNDETGELLQERGEELFRRRLEEALAKLGAKA